MKVKELITELLKQNQELPVEFMPVLTGPNPEEADAYELTKVTHANASGISAECVLIRGNGFWF